MVELPVSTTPKSKMDPEKRRIKKEKRKQKRLAAAAAKEEELEKTRKEGFEDKVKEEQQEEKVEEKEENGKEMTKAEKKRLKKEAKKKKKREMEEAKEEVKEEPMEEDKEEEKPPKKKKNKKRKQLEEEETKEEPKEEEQVEEPAKKKKKKKDKKQKQEEQEDEDTDFVKKGSSAPSKPSPSTFKKCFYSPTERTKKLTSAQINSFLTEHSANITSDGGDVSSTIMFRPVLEFSDAGLDERCLRSCKGFEKPTPIQSLCWPVVSSGRDIVGIAETGSGKTLAFSVPALAHLLHRKESGEPAGVSQSPMMLVLAPTRELAMQSQEVLEAAGKTIKIKSTCLYGGVSKYEQRRDLRAGVQVVVATPGRLLDLVEEEELDLSGVSYLVLDEADRMLDQGFERAIRRIISLTHPERQTCLFSATWPDTIRELANDFLKEPVKVTIGSEDLAAGKKVQQIVEVVEDRSREWRIQKLLEKYHKNENRILIFVLYKKEADRVLNALQRKSWNCVAIHGDRSQEQRTAAVEAFKSGTTPILVATDVAARGLDIPDVEYVINYAFPLTIEDYVHRIGRTGRAGKSGIAHTFFQTCDKLRAGELVKVLKDSNQPVPEDMNQFDLCIKRKEHKLYGSFGPKTHLGPMKAATKIKFD